MSTEPTKARIYSWINQVEYTEEMPSKYIDICAKGGSTPEFCLKLRITKCLFNEWLEKYPEFKLAKFAGKLYAEAWYIQLAKDSLQNIGGRKQIDTDLFKWITGGRFGHKTSKELDRRLLEIEKALDDLRQHGLSSKLAEEPAYTE